MASPALRTVKLYYDVVSPHSWVAFEHLFRNKAAWNVDVKLKPMSLASVFACNNHGNPGNISAKFLHMCEDAELLGRYYDLPIRTPTDAHDKLFVKGSLAAMKLLTAVNLTQPEVTETLSRALWFRLWSRNQDITRRSSLIQTGMEAGLSESDMMFFMSKMRDKGTTITLRGVTNEAVKHGAFGSPTLVVQDTEQISHTLFGSDRMHIMLMLMGYEQTITREGGAACIPTTSQRHESVQ